MSTRRKKTHRQRCPNWPAPSRSSALSSDPNGPPWMPGWTKRWRRWARCCFRSSIPRNALRRRRTPMRPWTIDGFRLLTLPACGSVDHMMSSMAELGPDPRCAGA
eukprot:2667420-Amphidinium_carterae.1